LAPGLVVALVLLNSLLLLSWYQGKTGESYPNLECGPGDKPAWITYAESRGGDLTIWRFRSFLKGYDAEVEKIDATVHEIYREVSAQIDCTACANCCRVVSPVLNMADKKKATTGVAPTCLFLKCIFSTVKRK